MHIIGGIWMKPDPWSPTEPVFSFWSGSLESSVMTDMGYIPVVKHTIHFDIPENFDPLGSQVKVLIERKEKITKKFDAEVKQIDDAIKNLQCLTFNPTSGVVDVPVIPVQAPAPSSTHDWDVMPTDGSERGPGQSDY